MHFISHHISSIAFTVLSVIAGFYIGGLPVAWIILVLGVLEVSLSFDNAVVNASILKNWDKVWQDRFITWGMPIAVFGMRFLFPLIIVAIIADISPIDAFNLAMSNPDQYSATLKSSHHEIAAFGGAFLMMIFLKFFIDPDKDVHWLAPIERQLSRVGKLGEIQVALVCGILILVASTVPAGTQAAFFIAGLSGLITFVAVDALSTVVGGDESDKVGEHVVKQGVMGFLYLELIDASFSFDGVMGAFALSNNILVISLGLGIGAMFVRSLTIHLVNAGTLSVFRYLEHAAFWAIGALAVVTFIGVSYEVPEVITGLIGATFIGFGIWSSVKANKADRSITQ